MKRAVGPLDKRKRVTRCQACAKRQIKCQGGVPCEYCQRTKKICTPQAVSSATASTAFNVKCGVEHISTGTIRANVRIIWRRMGKAYVLWHFEASDFLSKLKAYPKKKDFSVPQSPP
ncbi:hypothetical protein Trisim1_004670 [Trichoderma cf. simile WF8]